MIRDIIPEKVDYDGTDKGKLFAAEVNILSRTLDTPTEVYGDQDPESVDGQLMSALAASDTDCVYKGTLDDSLDPNEITLTNTSSEFLKSYIPNTIVTFMVDKTNTGRCKVRIGSLDFVPLKSGGAELEADDLVPGATYSIDFTASDSELVLAAPNQNKSVTNMGDLADRDLNGIKRLSIWTQSDSDQATSGHNYPIEEAGSLSVSPINGSDKVIQTYTTLGNGVYVRTYDGADWEEWTEVGYRQKFYQGPKLSLPVARDDGSRLENGDFYNDTYIKGHVVFNRGLWYVPTFNNAVYLGKKADAPTDRTDGSALQYSDLYYNSDDAVLKEYQEDGTWVDKSVVHSDVSYYVSRGSNGVPATREDGTKLHDGDIYKDIELETVFVYRDSLWYTVGGSAVNAGRGDTPPSNDRPNGDPLEWNDLFYNTDTNNVMIYSNSKLDWIVHQGDTSLNIDIVRQDTHVCNFRGDIADNDISDCKEFGTYTQTDSSKCLISKGYPENDKTGILTVDRSYLSSDGFIQKYTTYEGIVWTRGSTDGTNFSGWIHNGNKTVMGKLYVPDDTNAVFVNPLEFEELELGNNATATFI